MISLIASVGRNLEIGRGGDLAFCGKGELGYFRETTMGRKILMGSRTFASLPRRLEGRTYYVASYGGGDFPEWVHVVEDLDSFLSEWRESTEEVFVIGGGSIYAAALPFADRLYLTEIDRECADADVFFPKFDAGLFDKEKVGEGEFDDGLTFARYVYTRK